MFQPIMIHSDVHNCGQKSAPKGCEVLHQQPIEPVLGRTMWVPHQEQQINNKHMTDSKQNGSNQEKVAFNRTRIGVQPRNIQGQTLLQLKPKKQ